MSRTDDADLYLACKLGNLVQIKKIIESNSKIRNNICDVIYSACFNGYLGVVKYLFETYSCDNISKDRCIINALRNSHYELVDYLVSIGAKNSLISNNNEDIINLSRDSKNIKTIQLLLNLGININQQNYDGNTAFMIACKYANINNNLDTIRFLLNRGADVNITNRFGKNALILAGIYVNSGSNIETVELLLNYGSDYAIRDDTGKCFLNYIRADHHDRVMKIINNLEFNKSYFMTINRELFDVSHEIIHHPESFITRIFSIKWNINNGDPIKAIKFKNLDIIDYFGIYDMESLEFKIIENTKIID
ncbi:ankyrin repeat protein [Megavirus baoshan]|uniref:Ankyrin repeat protein n=1 Tax=Megavirus baoshan TaxID=2496520 RepID=A0A3Q8U8F0_9VIRU|nr:ankyrin repeat protein [Megavirus baoshan]AZL89590.1 ankyrin repeat protein [Megavirus baoshan]